ncbi:MAG: hypothetical protein ACRDZM_11990, partial [Acidimicrobiia bacterium]
MQQPRTDLNKALPKGRGPRYGTSPHPFAARSNSPLDALVRGLAAIGDRFLQGRGPTAHPKMVVRLGALVAPARKFRACNAESSAFLARTQDEGAPGAVRRGRG